MPRYQRGRCRVGSTRWEVQQRRTSSTITSDTDSSSSSDSGSSSSSRSSQSSRNSRVSAASQTSNSSNSNSDQSNQRTSDNEVNRNSDHSNESDNTDFEINSDAESNASSGRSTVSISPLFNHSDSDSHNSDRSQILRVSSNSSSSSSSSNNGSNQGSPSDASPRSSNHSFLNSFRLANSDEDSSFRPLRLELPESPNPSIRSNDSNRSLASQPSPNRRHRITSFFFGIPNHLRSRGTSRPTRNTDSPVNLFEEHNEFAEVFNQSHPPPWASSVMTGPSSSTTINGNNGSMVATIFTFECSVCLESLDAPASIEVGVNPAEGQAPLIPPNDGMPMPGSSRGTRGGARGRKAQPLIHTLSLTDVVTTHCGHLYHRVCLEKWFSEQGKRTCPSCRKATPANKVIRLFPSISADSSPQLRRESNEAGPSSAGTATMPAAAATNNNVPIDCSTAAVPVHQPGGSISRACDSQQCRDLNYIHDTLINDFSDLQRRFDNLRDDDEIKEAQIQSLEEDNARKNDEILRLKRELDEHRTDRGSVSNGTKRRRH
ncbi:unnamed protein product [Orchesella dallaii]|uniref:RING-type domain-containing protein n=1 Tax=Orchesella dallaii TaxID=48710 RepID=A0ABP1QDZ6_9HEXA